MPQAILNVPTISGSYQYDFCLTGGGLAVGTVLLVGKPLIVALISSPTQMFAAAYFQEWASFWEITVVCEATPLIYCSLSSLIKEFAILCDTRPVSTSTVNG